jgi:hypothetical protein
MNAHAICRRRIFTLGGVGGKEKQNRRHVPAILFGERLAVFDTEQSLVAKESGC